MFVHYVEARQGYQYSAASYGEDKPCRQSDGEGLTHRNAHGHSAPMQVPVEIHGTPPVIAFNVRLDCLLIGSTLCLSYGLSPGICRHPTGRFCVIMPMRVTIPAETKEKTSDTPQTHAHAVD